MPRPKGSKNKVKNGEVVKRRKTSVAVVEPEVVEPCDYVAEARNDFRDAVEGLVAKVKAETYRTAMNELVEKLG